MTETPMTAAPDLDIDPCDGMVTLAGGVAVGVAALRLVWRLEEQGVALFFDERDRLICRPKARVSAEDADLIRQHLHDVRLIVEYVVPGTL